MRKLVLSSLLLVSAAAVVSCSSATYPLAGATGKIGSKVGEATMKIGMFGTFEGNAGIVEAAKKAGITTVGTVDYKITRGLFGASYTTIVTGE